MLPSQRVEFELARSQTPTSSPSSAPSANQVSRELEAKSSGREEAGPGRFKLDGALGAGLALALIGTCVTAPSYALLALLLLCAGAWCFSGWKLALLLGVLAGVGGYRAELRLAGYEQAWGVAKAQVQPGARCIADGLVEESPTLRGDRLQFIARVSLECSERVLSGDFRVRFYGGPTSLRRGDRVRVVAQLSPVQLLKNLELPSPLPGAARSGVVLSGSVLSLERVDSRVSLGAWVDFAREHARARIMQSFDPLAAPMARALVLGENDLSPEDDEAFKKSGLAHLLAVSGTHLVFAVVSLVAGLQALLARIQLISTRYCVSRISALLGCPLALLYADYAGGSGSAWRAAFMLCAVFAARALGRRCSAARSLGWSLTLGALCDPLLAYDISFLLSAAATVGLVCIGSPLLSWVQRRNFLGRNVFVSYLVASVLATLGSMLPCAPLLALMSPDLTLASVLANLIAAPLGELVALPFCLAHLPLSELSWLNLGLAKVAGGALLVVRAVAHWSAEMSSLAFAVPPPGPAHLLLMGAGMAGSLIALRQYGRRAALASLALCAALLGFVEWGARRGPLKPGELRVVQLDVGQGDASLVDLPDGKLMLIDAGGSVMGGVAGGASRAGADPGQRVILPLLRARRRDTVDIVVITHPHPDHYGGLESVLKGVRVGELWVSNFPGGKYYRELVSSHIRAVDVSQRCGELLTGENYAVDILGPCPTLPELGANDNSVVLRLRYGGQALLFTGDAEAAQESQLVDRYGAELEAIWLKVGHHGSRTSSGDEFLAQVRPLLAGISCGVRNSFGHPHPEVLSRLQTAGASTWRMDEAGSLELRGSQTGFWYTGFGLNGRRIELAQRSAPAPN